jgi:hypothetical protein
MASKNSQGKLQKVSIRSIYTKYWPTVINSVLILLVALTLRTYNLLSIPIFADEAIYVRWAQVMKAVSSLRFLPLTDGKQPLFMWSVIPFFKIFSDPLIAGRMVSVVCGLGSVIGIFLLTQALFKNTRVSLVAAFLYAVSPFTVFFDRMALADSMLVMFGIWSMFLGILTARTLRLDFAMLTGFALGGAWLTKSPAMFFLLLLPLTILVSGWFNPRRIVWMKVLKFTGLCLVSSIMAYGIYNILRLGPEFQMIALRNKDYIFPFSEVLKHPQDPSQGNIDHTIHWLWRLLPGTTLIIAILSTLVGFKKYSYYIIFLLAWFLIPLLMAAFVAKVFTARYILFTLPPLFVLAALGIGELLALRKKYYIALLLLVAFPSLWINYLLFTVPNMAPLPKDERAGYLEHWTSGYGIREVASFIKAEHEKEPEHQIVIGTEGFFGTLPDGLMIYAADIPHVVIRGVGLSINTVHDSLINAKRAGDKVYLVANTSRLEYGAYDQGLKVIASYPKAIQPSGKYESLLLFEVTDESVKIFDQRNAKEAAEKLKNKK